MIYLKSKINKENIDIDWLTFEERLYYNGSKKFILFIYFCILEIE